MIRVCINGEERTLDERTSIAALLDSMGRGAAWTAVERNREVVSRTVFAETRLEDGDVLEIVQLVGGG